MCQHKTSRLRSQQSMVIPLYLQELNLRFYTFLLPSQEYSILVHLDVVNVNKQSCSFKENCCKNGCTQQNFMGFNGFVILISWLRQPNAIQAFLFNFLVYFAKLSKILQENCEYHHPFLCSLEWLM